MGGTDASIVVMTIRACTKNRSGGGAQVHTGQSNAHCNIRLFKYLASDKDLHFHLRPVCIFVFHAAF